MGVDFKLDYEVDVDDVLESQVRELEFLFSTEFLQYFLGVEITEWLRLRAERRFAREGDDASGKWKPLAEFTREERRSLGYGGAHPINVRTGELEDWVMQGSFSIQGDENSGVYDLEWPSRLPTPGTELDKKVKTAQKGKRQQGHGVPARPVVAVGEIDLTHLLSQYALDMKRAGVRFDG